MSSWTIVWRNLLYYRRTHLGVILGTALSAMVLIGALLVGDSVKSTLKELALLRIGEIDASLYSSDRYFREDLADDLKLAWEEAVTIAPAVMLQGNVTTPDRASRANDVQILGVDNRFWQLSPSGKSQPFTSLNEIHINTKLATKLDVAPGDTLVLRVEKPGNLSRDAPLSGAHDSIIAIRGVIKSVVSDEDFGRFGLQASQIPSPNVYLSLPLIQERLDLKKKANMLLVGSPGSHSITADRVNLILQKQWQLEDMSLSIRELMPARGWELRSNQVFLDPSITRAVHAILPNRTDVLTYFVNEIRTRDRVTPYSFVTAFNPTVNSFIPDELGEDEIIINQWLADDLDVKIGESIELRYYVVGERRNLVERLRQFQVRHILPMTHPGINLSWMPDFPGLADAENCRDWEPGIPIELDRIRDKDETYWDQYRGTPKAFINLSRGQEMWSNRWGNLTAIRYQQEIITREIFTASLRDQMDITRVGLYFIPLREETLAATQSPIDFGQLFIGFSFFIITASAVLTGLLFVFSVEQRNHETGLLLAVGFRGKETGQLILREGAILSVIGSLIGAGAAVIYTHIVIYALSTVWRDAVGAVVFSFKAMPSTIGGGIILNIIIALFVMWLASRKQLRRPVSQLLGAEGLYEQLDSRGTKIHNRRAIMISVLSFLLALSIIYLVGVIGKGHEAEIFFGAGSLLLISGVALFSAWLGRISQSGGGVSGISHLGQLNVTRRRGRSLATTAVLACGVFMVVAVNTFRHDPLKSASERRSGTGGFALIGESTIPVYHDLNEASVHQLFVLNKTIMEGVAFVPFRVLNGDDASCLNLNRAQRPRLLGVKPDDLHERGAFRFSSLSESISPADGWRILETEISDRVIPAVADEVTVKWALGKTLDDTLTFKDERGQPFELQIAGIVAGSILQGNLIISEEQFIDKFPSHSGYKAFLIDTPIENAETVVTHLAQSLENLGLELTPAWIRLAEFQSIEHAYISIFQVLGGLGLLLGSVGLGVVVARNMLERQREFALLAAVGFRKGLLRRLVFIEHRWLIVWGLLIGILTALVAVWPTLQSRGAYFPFLEMVILILALSLGCILWTWIAAYTTLRGSLIVNLRSE